MEKKNKLILFFSIFVFIPLLIVFRLFRMERQFFWVMLFTVIFLIRYYHLKSGGIMLSGFITFLIGVFFTIINHLLVAEFAMRISLIFWLMGLFLAIWEVLMDKKANRSSP